MSARPAAVAVISAFAWAATALSALVAVMLLAPSPKFAWIWNLNPPAHAAFSAHARVAGVLLLALAVVSAGTARGLLRGRRWAWFVSLATFAANGLGDVVSFFITHDWLRSASGVLIATVFLFLLFRPSVRAWFAPPG